MSLSTAVLSHNSLCPPRYPVISAKFRGNITETSCTLQPVRLLNHSIGTEKEYTVLQK